MNTDDFSALEPKLDKVFARYREACGSPEAAVNFMPNLWQKIEARQYKRLSFERGAKALMAAAAAMALGLSLFLFLPAQSLNSSTYVEAVATEEVREFDAFLEPVRLELSSADQNGNGAGR